MIAGVLIEYSVKSLDKTFDYIVPKELEDKIKIGHKVLVPFGRQIVEGFVMDLKNTKDTKMDYKEIQEIVESTFCLNSELIELGKYIQKTTLSTLISAYQSMFPKALKASSKTMINVKTKTLCYLNPNINIEEYLEANKRNKKEIEIIHKLQKETKIERKEYKRFNKQ